MQSIVVLSYEQIASLSVEELLDLAREKAVALTRVDPESQEQAKPYFFVRTKSGRVDLKQPPKIEIVISSRRI